MILNFTFMLILASRPVVVKYVSYPLKISLQWEWQRGRSGSPLRHKSWLCLDSGGESQVSPCDVKTTLGKSSCWITSGVEWRMPAGCCEKYFKKTFQRNSFHFLYPWTEYSINACILVAECWQGCQCFTLWLIDVKDSLPVSQLKAESRPLNGCRFCMQL